MATVVCILTFLQPDYTLLPWFAGAVESPLTQVDLQQSLLDGIHRMLIDALSAALATMLQDETTFARAEALYAESFKAPKGFTVADEVYSRAELVAHIMEPLYRVEADPSSAHDDWYEPALFLLKPGLEREEAEQLVDELEFIELCNYKGEGEGYVLACRAKHLRTFVGKYDYLAA